MTGANQMVGRSQSGSSSADALRGLQGINLSSGSGISTPPGSQPESSSQDPSARPTAGSQRPSLLQHQWQQAQQQGDTSQQQSPQQPPPPQQPAAQQQDSQNQEAQEHPRLAQQPASRSREGQSQPKLYTEAEFQELLAMLHPSAVRQPSNPMFVSPSSVEEARHQAQAIEEEKKKKVPELVDGFRANLIKSLSSDCIDDAILKNKYIPIPTILALDRGHSACEDDKEMVLMKEGTLKSKSFSRKNECSLPFHSWLTGMNTLIWHTQELLPTFSRANRLASHVVVASGIAQSHGIDIAYKYNIRQRELAADDHHHDIKDLDVMILTLVSSTAMVSAAKLQQSMTSSFSYQCQPSTSSPSKRKANPSAESPSKCQKTTACFCCGFPGYVALACTAAVTKAEETIGFFRTSLLELVPKPNSNSFCLIQDMSYPRNDPDLTSVNAGISADDFPTEWGTFNKTAKLILSLPPGCMAATFDILVAYHLTPIRPDQQWALCIYWNNYVHVDHAVMFGLTSSASVFGAVADMLIAIYQASGYRAILKWVDDFLVIHFPDNTWSEEEFMDLTEKFGVP
uniref:Reverse transcriptase domain-containing protein n=1 Tax=Moniliophthora roreri TaxID=221103 RepID=A0A0W0G4N3_MONRR